MGAEPYRCSFSWPVVEGSHEKQITIQVGESSAPDFVPLDDLLDLDMCLVLGASSETEACEMRLSIAPLYLPRAISLVVECPVIECYYGRLNEYHNTYHGELVYTLEDVKVFRFDIRISSDIDELQLKFISHKDDPLCLYGTRLYLARNPDPLRTMMMGGKRINPTVVQQRLQDADLSEKAEKCKRIILGSMQSSRQNVVNNNAQPESPAGTTAVAGNVKTAPDGGLSSLLSKMEILPGQTAGSPLADFAIKQYIDTKFLELGRMLENKLTSIEAQQTAKLDRILALLQKNNEESGSVE
ncbi:uncharacterized protein LOC128720514 [Anopheles nili]|uniref:uncharacterized protein LOC128720514 n=1 Tax=Anopheles nili TaxID=185578 RepID=UPI00237BE577|nr:uncharacterized protein LOC128720514 [Anopheles nili]